MAVAPESDGLKRVLDAADRLGRLRQNLTDRGESDRRTGRTVRAESRRAVRAVTDDLDRGAVPGALGKLHERHRFDDEQLTILLLLLQRRIQESRQTLTGREILAFLHEASFERLRGLRHLSPSGLLRRAGMIEVDPASAGRDLLDAEIRLAETVFRAIERDVTPEVEARDEPGRWQPKPYRDHREHLLDMARLSRLYQRRARRVFESEEPDETVSHSAVRHLDREIRRLRHRIQARLEATPGSASFTLQRLRREHRLTDDEELVLVTLLFQEIYAGTSYIEAIELVKMLSASDLELMERRQLLTAEGTLMKRGLVLLTDEEGEHQLGGEAYLPPEIVQALLTGPGPQGPIDADARLEWHEYLEGLDDSEPFFRQI